MRLATRRSDGACHCCCRRRCEASWPLTADGRDGQSRCPATVLSGYKAKTRNGETVYCKKVARIGSNFATETCMTAAEAEELERRADFERQAVPQESGRLWHR